MSGPSGNDVSGVVERVAFVPFGDTLTLTVGGKEYSLLFAGKATFAGETVSPFELLPRLLTVPSAVTLSNYYQKDEAFLNGIFTPLEVPPDGEGKVGP